MTDPNIKVTFGSLEELAANIDTQVQAINGNIETLRSKIGAVEAEWEGRASEGFQNTKHQWEGAVTHLNGVLAKIKTAVHVSTDGYRDAEDRNRKRWDL
jgi:ESAT-6 family protein